MIPETDLELGDLRLLDVDNSLVLPIDTNIRLLVTSNDVIHSFAVPSLGIKSDAIPGRLNATGIIINRTSKYYGQCSELCGVLHGFMPITINAVTLPEYINYISNK
jgi:cytochrome c oxidase subunit 2